MQIPGNLSSVFLTVITNDPLGRCMKKTKENKLTILISMLLLSMVFAGCARGSVFPAGDPKYEEYDYKKAAENRSGAEAYRRVAACGEYRFDPEGRSFIDGNKLAGEWIKTDEEVIGEEYPNQYDIRYWNIEDSYLPGSVIDVDLTFHVDHDRIGASDDIWG